MAVFTKSEYQIHGVTIRNLQTTGSSNLLVDTGPECLCPSSFIHRSGSGARSEVRDVLAPKSDRPRIDRWSSEVSGARVDCPRRGQEHLLISQRPTEILRHSLFPAPLIITRVGFVGFYSVQLKFFGTINQIQIILRVWTF